MTVKKSKTDLHCSQFSLFIPCKTKKRMFVVGQASQLDLVIVNDRFMNPNDDRGIGVPA